MTIDPIKLCCGRPASEHRGRRCPDGKTMCCICFGRFEITELYVYPGDAQASDVCTACAAKDDLT